ncbi:Uncharacterized 2Fe-2 and 4Fe-4S clusters-containing protein, contains DUF4445 domain [Desulfatibacillum alkenivorans DSM 16219]|uniref:Uncharacterized 2Fe-2 and 4Fe-4S clusters-containing protein, contains DUF4445 domain n=1 Tax=Desulfatibacillum alkenivorans DSM 16219 TaxID=1121393 RepID=A0A1M6CF08_9BACT|nr:ASKHA domain-containing protein [Desulfatibacillum alkenivorans]SHI59599.1 Uncharacterized 2Fe-2 and 4Fe-4S clusters-containing protein, contains DUF4445 domain [Desulfatibacillum alkenivorans DSM 16219]
MNQIASECQIEIQPMGLRTCAFYGAGLHESLVEAGVALASDCETGSCGLCKVVANGPGLSGITDAERSLLAQHELDAGIRLACQCIVQGDVRVYVPASSILPLRPRELKPPKAPLVRPEDFDPVAEDGTCLGLAVDLGAAQISGCLYDLKTGEKLADAGMINPSAAFGEDAAGKLNEAASNPQGAKMLSRFLRAGVNALAEGAAVKAGASRLDIKRICLVGAPGMIRLLRELPLPGLLAETGRSVASPAVILPAQDLELDVSPQAKAFLPPTPGGSAGADLTALIMALGLDRSDKPALALSMGVDAEAALYLPQRDRLYTISCPPGPALEGAGIKDGMLAAQGAVERVFLSGNSLIIKTIGNVKPIGLCGSGALDAAAALLRLGVMDEMGRLKRKAGGVRQGEEGLEFVLVPRSQSGSGRDIVLTQKDVRQIQIAKSAVRTGIECLLEAAGAAPESIEHVFLAGAYGSDIHLSSAAEIGLTPNFPRARPIWAGAAAGAGAGMMLGSLQYRLRADRIASSAKHLNIKKHPGFNRRFALSLRFPPPQSHGAKSGNAGSSPALPYAFGNSAAHGLNHLQDHNQAACRLYRGQNKAFAE